jgi:hypothetical protein
MCHSGTGQLENEHRQARKLPVEAQIKIADSKQSMCRYSQFFVEEAELIN